MPHKKFICAYNSGPLSYLISIRKALRILLAHKIRDARLQLLLFKWTGTLFSALAAGICILNLMPMFLAMGIFAHLVCLVAFLLWVGAGDIFLKFALEDERFYELATESRALSIFVDTDFALPQPEA